MVRTELPEVTGEPLPVEPLPDGLEGVAYAVTAGVPHLCVLVAEPAQVDVVSWGRRLRHDPRFEPEGVNVDFVTRDPASPVPIRTYERGVEDETLACGSGAVAAALVLFRTAERESPVVFETRSRELLEVVIEPAGGARYRVALGGSARLVYRGELP
jgi:diaminopimelate epimerase